MRFEDYEEAVRMIVEANSRLMRSTDDRTIKMDIYEAMRLNLTNFLPCSGIVSSTCNRTGRTAYSLGQELSEAVWREFFE